MPFLTIVLMGVSLTIILAIRLRMNLIIVFSLLSCKYNDSYLIAQQREREWWLRHCRSHGTVEDVGIVGSCMAATFRRFNRLFAFLLFLGRGFFGLHDCI